MGDSHEGWLCYLKDTCSLGESAVKKRVSGKPVFCVSWVLLPSVTFLPKSPARGRRHALRGQDPTTLRVCLAGLGWRGGAVHRKGRQAARGWWIWMRGARREGQGSREGFPLGCMAPSLPTRKRQVPAPILALSAALERGWSLSESVCQPGAEINAWSWCLGSRQ